MAVMDAPPGDETIEIPCRNHISGSLAQNPMIRPAKTQDIGDRPIHSRHIAGIGWRLYGRLWQMSRLKPAPACLLEVLVDAHLLKLTILKQRKHLGCPPRFKGRYVWVMNQQAKR